MSQPEQPVEAGDLDLPKMAEQVETHLLGHGRQHTRHDVAEHAGLSADEVRAMWRALGFASVDDDERVFSDADVEALKNVVALQSIGGIGDELMHAMTRIIGQAFARLASWQGQMMMEIVGERPELLADGGAGLLGLMDNMIPVVSDLHSYVWRRQLNAYFARVASNMSTSPGSATPMAVGFVDMAGFTTFTRESSEAQLRDVLTAFETLTTDLVGAHRGQIVKTIGDEVLFVADGARDAAEIALHLLAAAGADDLLPQVRAGLAYGPVVSRLGDVFGQTVNIASRLTSLARTDSILVDDGMAEQLGSDSSYALRSLRPTSVRGYHHLHSSRLRRAEK